MGFFLLKLGFYSIQIKFQKKQKYLMLKILYDFRIVLVFEPGGRWMISHFSNI